MADQKISQLPGAGAAQGADEIPIVRSGVNYTVTAGAIAALTPTSVWGSITGSLSSQADLQSALTALSSAVSAEAARAETIEAGLVPKTTMVAGHALSGNVAVSASDLTAGVLASGTTASTQAPLDSSTKLATTAYVDLAVAAGGGGGGSGSSVWGAITGTLSAQLDLAAALNALASNIGSETSRAESAEGQLTPKSTTINGHPLTANIVVSASDLTTGVLPHASLPALLSADIPNNAASTSGSAASLSGASALPNGTTATTQTAGDSSTKIATTAFVATAVAAGGGAITWGSISGTLSAQADLQSALTSISASVTSETSRATTAEGALVPKTTTVNGHALSANVTVSASDLTTGTLPHAQLPALLSADIPNNAANTSGTAANLSGTPALPNGTTATTQTAGNNTTRLATTAYADAAVSVETTRAVTAEGNLVPKTITVNGHALSTNVTVSASDISTGTLPHAQLPGLLSGDIPNNAANTSGTASNLSGTPTLPNGTAAVTQSQADGSSKLATTSYVDTAVGSVASSIDSVQTVNSSGSVTFGGTVNTVIKVTTGSSALVSTLPTAIGVAGRRMKFIKVDSGAGSMSFGTVLSQTVSGMVTLVENQWQYIEVESDNANWIVVSHN